MWPSTASPRTGAIRRAATTKAFDRKLYWLRQILDWQGETRDSQEFIDAPENRSVRRGGVHLYPQGRYHRHAPRRDARWTLPIACIPPWATSCVGAKVNGRIVPLDTPLETGDRVEIMTSSAAKGPSMDWLKIVKTQQARAPRSASIFKRELRGENVTKGKDHAGSARPSAAACSWAC